MSAALIPLTTARERAAAPAAGRPRADFVAQLIATRTEAPQTRARRRAKPEEAIAAYRTLGRLLRPSGGALSRWL